MTPRERLLTVLSGGIPDCVPVMPDISNMVPARLTGKPFWDIYLYNDPPIWEAYIAAAKHFNFDTLYDCCPFVFPEEIESPWERFIVHRDERRIIVQSSIKENGKRIWQPHVEVFPVADPPTGNVPIDHVGLPPVPERYEPLEGVKPVDIGPEGLKHWKSLLGDQGLCAVPLGTTAVLHKPEDVYDYYDNPAKYDQLAEERIVEVEDRFARFMALDVKPDFFVTGGSGTLVFQTIEIFRKVALPAVKRGIELATAAGIPTHVHSCGPEAALVKCFAEETSLTVIDPLEPPPMGDCDLAELKRLYGDKITLKGNLHTTEVMLHGSVEDVIRASKQAIDDAAAGGRFILSTGDQCGRDTPDENLAAMIETARTYGRY